uniref:Uncharacterized protein n=1 Tax=Salix viminalis TaxID=40686 RepID=A0A6N2LRS2_SALVM
MGNCNCFTNSKQAMAEIAPYDFIKSTTAVQLSRALQFDPVMTRNQWFKSGLKRSREPGI